MMHESDSLISLCPIVDSEVFKVRDMKAIKGWGPNASCSRRVGVNICPRICFHFLVVLSKKKLSTVDRLNLVRVEHVLWSIRGPVEWIQKNVCFVLR